MAWRVLAIALLIASVAQANMVLEVGNTVAGFKPSYAYTIADLDYADRPFMDVVSGNGSVIKYSTPWEWSGSYHGHEVVEQTSLTIDGAAAAVQDNVTYTALDRAYFSRTTVLGGGYRLTHDMQIESSKIIETAHFTGLPEGPNVEVFYAFLGTRSNRLTRYAAFDENGNLLQSGSTVANQDALPLLQMPPGSMAVAQYDPIAGDGVLTAWAVPSPIRRRPDIQDRSGDNKLYFSLDTVGSPNGRDFTITQSLTFFTAPPESWESAAIVVDRGDMDGNGVVDNFDIQAFELALTDADAFHAEYPLVTMVGARGDFNLDGSFDNFDIEGFESYLTPSSGVAVPEPSTLALGAMGLAALPWRGRRRACSR